MTMKATRNILHALVLAVLALAPYSCQTRTFADDCPIREAYDAAGMDVPYGEGQFPIDGNAVLAIIRQGVPANAGFEPATLVSLSDNEGRSCLLFFSKDRRYFMLENAIYRLTPRQAKRVNKLI